MIHNRKGLRPNASLIMLSEETSKSMSGTVCGSSGKAISNESGIIGTSQMIITIFQTIITPGVFINLKQRFYDSQIDKPINLM